MGRKHGHTVVRFMAVIVKKGWVRIPWIGRTKGVFFGFQEQVRDISNEHLR